MKKILLPFVLAFLLMLVVQPFSLPGQTAALAATGAQNMPPHPRLNDEIKSGAVKLPAFTDQVPSRSPATGVKGPSLAPLTGTLRVLVILVDFSDQARTVNASYFDTLMFANPVNGRGSVRDYFGEISYGAVDIVTVNMPSALGWRRAPNSKAYYVNNNYCVAATYPNNCQRLAEELVNAVDSVVDFAAYDNDGNGETEPIMIVHSGPGAEFTGSLSDIWSHSWSLNAPLTRDGKTIFQYTIQPEFWQTVNPTTSDMTIGVFA
ncbi:MAG: hypothetical protein EHM21_16400, partial [Chloroflexi bacterium]